MNFYKNRGKLKGFYQLRGHIEDELPRPKGRGIKDKNKMLKLTNPRLRKSNITNGNYATYNFDFIDNYSKILNLMEDGDSSPNLKIWVSSPLM